MEQVDALIEQLRKADYNDREAIRQQLVELASGDNGPWVREHIERAAKGQILEIKWELEEIVEETSPKKPEPEPEEAEEPKEAEEPEQPEDPNRPLTAADLTLVYDDPRGLMLHKSKVGERWFVTQVDPRTGQPQTFELHPQEVEQLKTQLKGSPYWVLGAGS